MSLFRPRIISLSELKNEALNEIRNEFNQLKGISGKLVHDDSLEKRNRHASVAQNISDKYEAG